MDGNLTVSSTLINEGIKFSSVVVNKPEVITDYVPPLGDGKSLMPLEVFLVSLTTCLGGSVAFVLRRMMKKTIKAMTIGAEGVRHTEHPTCFEKITLTIRLTSPDAQTEELQKAVQLSEEKYCPVWAMIKNNVEVTCHCEVNPGL